MKKTIKLGLAAIAISLCGTANAQQITNGDFESEWVDCFPWEKGDKVTKAYGTQPTGWCISNVPNSLVTVYIGSNVSGNNSNSAVQIKNTSAAGNGIPGYMTLGTTWATAETKMTSTRNKDGGVFGGVQFTYRPDALRLVYKRDNSASTNDVSTVVIYTWKGTTSQADVPSNTAVGVFSWGSATKVPMTNRDNNILDVKTNTGGDITYSDGFKLLSSTTQKITGAASSWTTLNIPLEYKDATVAPEMMNIVIAAAGYQDGGNSITDGVSLTVDDVEFVYYHALSALSYDGATINFDENTTSYELSDVKYDASKLHYTVKGIAATAKTSYDEETAKLSIIVTGEDGSSTTYTIQFYKKPAPQIVSTKTYSENLYVTVDGVTAGPQNANIVVDTYDDGTINFTLKNFALETTDEDTGEPAILYVGNISVTNIEVKSDKTFSYKDDIQIAAGDDPAGANWYGPYLGNIPLDMNGEFVGDNLVLVTIDISMMGQVINVHLGYDRAAMSVTSAKYATFCAPIDVTIPSGVTAYKVNDVDDNNVLVMESISETIPANTAVVLNSESEVSSVYSDYYPSSSSSCTTGLLTGIYADTPITSGYVLQNQPDYGVGFYKVTTEMTIPANRAYIATVSSNSKTLYFSDATAIQAIKALTSGDATEIYSANGTRQNKLQKGLNIMKMSDGKSVKVMVK